MSLVSKQILGTIIGLIVLAVLNACGLLHSAAKPGTVSTPVVHLTLIGAAAVPDVQATIYSAEWCEPCREYVKAVKAELPPDGWIVRDATDADAGTAHVIITKDDKNFVRFKIHTVPCTIIRRGGKEVRRFTRRLTPDELVDAINAAAGKK